MTPLDHRCVCSVRGPLHFGVGPRKVEAQQAPYLNSSVCRAHKPSVGACQQGYILSEVANTVIGEEHPRVTWVGRVLGIFNLLFAGVGLVALLINYVGFRGLPSSFTGESPLLDRRFYAMSAASLLLLMLLAYAGIQILRGSSSASTLCSVVFCAEIVFFLAFWAAWRLPFSPVSVVAVAAGLTNLGLALQAITGYPLVGLVLLKLFRPTTSQLGV